MNMLVAFGAGVVVGVAGMFFVFKNNFRKVIEKKMAEKLEEKAADLKK